MLALFVSPVHSLKTRIHGPTGIAREREFTWWGTREERSTEKLGLVWGSNPGRLRDRQVLYPLCYAPWAPFKLIFILNFF